MRSLFFSLNTLLKVFSTSAPERIVSHTGFAFSRPPRATRNLVVVVVGGFVTGVYLDGGLATPAKTAKARKFRFSALCILEQSHPAPFSIRFGTPGRIVLECQLRSKAGNCGVRVETNADCGRVFCLREAGFPW